MAKARFSMSPKTKFLTVAVAMVGFFVLLQSQSNKTDWEAYHTEEELSLIRGGGGNLPGIGNGLFMGSGRCNGCHGYDFTGFAGWTTDGENVNVVDSWRSSIMANSAKDPFWKAKVSHEITVNPQNSVELQDKCTSCHAPMGNFGALHNGEEHYNMEMLDGDIVGKDGVSCNACHQQTPEDLGNVFSGELTWEESILFGQHGGPGDDALFAGPMTNFVGFEPVYGEHISKSETCATCHSLLTNTADLDGNLTGNKFVEQATYHEWLNSVYADEVTGEECQGCHMPRIQDSIIISANYANLERRGNFGLHTLVGANTFMLEMFRDNVEELGLTASEEQFQTTLDLTMDMLQNQSVDIEASELGVEGDLAKFEVKLTNKAGHKFPSGYPARRAFIKFSATDEDGNVIFESGAIDSSYEVVGQDDNYEPHYDIITDPNQVQIYELVLGDVNSDVTTLLERADFAIKDNRLTPLGFTTTHEVYDTTLIAGTALIDPNFNKHEDGTEGSGADIIKYHVPLDGYSGVLNISVELYYQSAPPKWMAEMFSVDTEAINYFQQLYEETGADPVLVVSEEFTAIVTGVEELTSAEVAVFPNPVVNGSVNVVSKNMPISSIEVYDALGKRLVRLENLGLMQHKLNLDYAPGTYIVKVRTSVGVRTERIVVR